MDQKRQKTLNQWYLPSCLSGLILLGLSGCGDDGVNPTPTPSIPNQSSINDWTNQMSNVGTSLTDIFFDNASLGWVVGDEVVLSTSNGGNSWPFVPGNVAARQLKSVCFIDADRGWMVGGESDSQTGEVFISQQGGAYPEVQKTVENSLNAVFFLGNGTGWAAGENGLVINTTDAGVNWTPLNIDTGLEIFDLHFSDDQNGWAVTENGGIYRTQDGINLLPQNIDATSSLLAVHFVDTLHGWVCGSDNTIFRRHLTSDNVVTWSSVSIAQEPQATTWHDIFFLDPQTGWVVGSEGRVYRSNDGGISWLHETTGVIDRLNAIHMVSQTKGWIAGDDGIILTYTP